VSIVPSIFMMTPLTFNTLGYILTSQISQILNIVILNISLLFLIYLYVLIDYNDNYIVNILIIFFPIKYVKYVEEKHPRFLV
jgi:hypothetical protein